MSIFEAVSRLNFEVQLDYFKLNSNYKAIQYFSCMKPAVEALKVLRQVQSTRSVLLNRGYFQGHLL